MQKCETGESHRKQRDNALKVKTQIYIWVQLADRHAYRWGIRDHFFRLSLRLCQGYSNKKENSIVILMPSIVLRREPEQNSKKEASERKKERKPKEVKQRKSPDCWWKTESMALDPASPRKCCQSKEAEHCPTSCVGPVPAAQHCKLKANACVHKHRDTNGCMCTVSYKASTQNLNPRLMVA